MPKLWLSWFVWTENRFLFKSLVSVRDLPQYLWTLLRFCSPRALVTIRWATAQSVLGRLFTGWINSGKQQPRVKMKGKKKHPLLRVWKELDLLIWKPWPWPFYSLQPEIWPSASDARWTERGSLKIWGYFYRNSDYHIHCKVPSHTCWLTGENSQSVCVVDPLDLYPAITEDRQEKHILK